MQEKSRILKKLYDRVAEMNFEQNKKIEGSGQIKFTINLE